MRYFHGDPVRRHRPPRPRRAAGAALATAAVLALTGQPALAGTAASNTPPEVPAQLTVAGLTCTEGLAVGTGTPTLAAWLTDPDAVPPYAERVRATFAWWPVDQPTRRTEWTSTAKSAPTLFQYQVPPDTLLDGTTYAFAVQATDPSSSSAWSSPCPFTVDVTAPGAPTVTSVDYPDDGGWHGGPWTPGQFTFDAGGDPDALGFRYTLEGGPLTHVAADQPGGTAQVTLTPGRRGPTSLKVSTVDRAGNRSPVTTYSFRVW